VIPEFGPVAGNEVVTKKFWKVRFGTKRWEDRKEVAGKEDERPKI
jgi:hypothetical protein